MNLGEAFDEDLDGKRIVYEFMEERHGAE